MMGQVARHGKSRTAPGRRARWPAKQPRSSASPPSGPTNSRSRRPIAAWPQPAHGVHQFTGALRRGHSGAWPLPRCRWFRRGWSGLRSLRAGAPMIQRPSSRAPSGTTTHRNHRPPLAPLTSQIAKTKRLIASQDPQAARHAGESLACRASIGPPERSGNGGPPAPAQPDGPRWQSHSIGRAQELKVPAREEHRLLAAGTLAADRGSGREGGAGGIRATG